MVKDCNYDKPNEMVRDKIDCGVNTKEIREKLLTEGDTLTMEKAIEIAVTYETTQQHLQSMACHAQGQVDFARRRHQTKQQKPERRQDRTQAQKSPLCKNCGGKHRPKQCPAFGQQCRNCGKMNHWAKVCLSGKKQVNYIQDEEEDEEAPVFTDAITGGKKADAAYAYINIGPDSIHFKLDTGAQANIIPIAVFENMQKKHSLSANGCKLYGYSGSEITTKGTTTLECSYKGQKHQGIFHIVDNPPNAQPILGLKACLALNLIKLILSVEKPAPLTKDSVLKEYQQVFTGLGELEGEVKLHLKEQAVPVIHPVRRVPHALRDRLRTEINKTEESGVIKRVTTPMDWVNSLVVVEKPGGKLRICLDPRGLNEAIKRPHYPMPTLDNALSKMAGAKYFSKLDAKSGYWQMKLNEESSYLTTFNTPFGRYRFCRLPFGIVSSQDEFQRKMDEIFEDIPGTTPLVDDVIVHGKTQEEHDQNLRAALDRAASKHLTLSPEKLTVGAEEVSYFGHIFTADGLKPDPGKVKAIVDMGPPKDKKDLQTVLGMMTYLAKFAP